jgi:rare lipoprotein A (peptidoglycan hydrolase)
LNRDYGRPRQRPGTPRRYRRRDYGPASGPRPDRVAAWAVGLGIFLILVASATSKGATGGATLPADGAAGARPAASRSLDPVTAAKVDELQARLGLAEKGLAQGAARRAVVAEMSVAVATWYGPGLYGRKTACGLRLTRKTVGVAHRRLPCGTEVTFYYRGHFRTLPVIDRGPFTHGASWDLTAAAARSIELSRTSRVRVIR